MASDGLQCSQLSHVIVCLLVAHGTNSADSTALLEGETEAALVHLCHSCLSCRGLYYFRKRPKVPWDEKTALVQAVMSRYENMRSVGHPAYSSRKLKRSRSHSGERKQRYSHSYSYTNLNSIIKPSSPNNIPKTVQDGDQTVRDGKASPRPIERMGSFESETSNEYESGDERDAMPIISCSGSVADQFWHVPNNNHRISKRRSRRKSRNGDEYHKKTFVPTRLQLELAQPNPTHAHHFNSKKTMRNVLSMGVLEEKSKFIPATAVVAAWDEKAKILSQKGEKVNGHQDQNMEGGSGSFTTHEKSLNSLIREYSFDLAERNKLCMDTDNDDEMHSGHGTDKNRHDSTAEIGVEGGLRPFDSCSSDLNLLSEGVITTTRPIAVRKEIEHEPAFSSPHPPMTVSERRRSSERWKSFSFLSKAVTCSAESPTPFSSKLIHHQKFRSNSGSCVPSDLTDMEDNMSEFTAEEAARRSAARLLGESAPLNWNRVSTGSSKPWVHALFRSVQKLALGLVFLVFVVDVQENWILHNHGHKNIKILQRLLVEVPSSQVSTARHSNAPTSHREQLCGQHTIKDVEDELRDGSSCAPGEIPCRGSRDCLSICPLQWHGLDVLDLSIAASLAAFDLEASPMVDFLERSEGEWKVVGSSKKNDLVTFYDLYSAKLNVSVITIRGTSPRLADVIQDLNIYSEVGILQIMSLVPGLRLWPQETTANFIKAMDKLQGFFLDEEMSHYYFESVVDYVASIHGGTSVGQPRKVVVVGHSLGGSLAKITGCLTKTRAVGFSSPGILLSRRKFGIDKHDVQSLVTNIYAENDVVPWVDQMGGVTQQVQCPDGLWCHRMSNIICELWRKCPNRRNEGSQFIPPSLSLGGGCTEQHLPVFG